MSEIETEQSGTDVISEESSTPSESETSESQSVDTKSADTKDKEQHVPYDRFKELIDHKNQISKQFEESQKEIKALRERFEQQSKPPTPAEKKIHEILREKGVEPEFVKWVEEQEKSRQELASLRENSVKSERQSYLTGAGNTVSRLQAELKVDPVLHEMYLSRIPDGTPLKDIEAAYKGHHDKMSKFLETQKRANLAQYSAEKKTAAAVPAPKKGQPAKPAKTNAFSKDPYEARQQMVKEMAAAMRGGRNTN